MTFSPFGNGMLVPSLGAPPLQDPEGKAETRAVLSWCHRCQGAGQSLDGSSDPGQRRLLGTHSGWKLAPISPGEIAIVLSSVSRAAGGHLSMPRPERVDSLVELPIPTDMRQRIAEVEVEPGAQFRPLHRVEMAGGRLWAISVGMVDPVAFSIPLAEGEPSIRVVAEGLNDGEKVSVSRTSSCSMTA